MGKTGLWLAAALLAANTVRAQELCVPGRAVSVSSNGVWYAGRVVEGPDKMGTCLVSYDGFPRNYDEWVNPKRLRPAAPATGGKPSAGAQARQEQRARAQASSQAAQAGAAGKGGVQPGRYSCYTFDAGQLNYAFVDVVVEGPGRYAVGNARGSYTIDGAGAMRFTGTLSNATGKYSIRSGGKPQILLVFNGDNRASMSCGISR